MTINTRCPEHGKLDFTLPDDLFGAVQTHGPSCPTCARACYPYSATIPEGTAACCGHGLEDFPGVDRTIGMSCRIHSYDEIRLQVHRCYIPGQPSFAVWGRVGLDWIRLGHEVAVYLPRRTDG